MARYSKCSKWPQSASGVQRIIFQ